jgi:hypothetical protein
VCSHQNTHRVQHVKKIHMRHRKSKTFFYRPQISPSSSPTNLAHKEYTKKATFANTPGNVATSRPCVCNKTNIKLQHVKKKYIWDIENQRPSSLDPDLAGRAHQQQMLTRASWTLRPAILDSFHLVNHLSQAQLGG